MSPASWSPSRIEAIRNGRAGRSRLVGLTASIASRMTAGDDQARIGCLSASLATVPLTCAFGAPRRIRTRNRQIRSLVLSVGLIGSRPIWPAHVGCLVGPDGSRRIQKDRLDDHRDDQGPSDRRSDAQDEQLLWWPPIPASGGWSLGLLLRVSGGALGLLGLGTGRPGPPAR